ncbi:MAG: flagellar biosynthesis protein FlgA [Chloroflexota bacterium]
MIYSALFDQVEPDKVVQAGIIGTGHFATATITQAQTIPRLSVPIVADLDVNAAREAYKRAGIAADDIIICDSRPSILQALEANKSIIVEDAILLMDLPLDVIVDSTGIPEAGAKHGLAAIEHGKHIAMVNKEADVTVGPMLKYLADQAGVVYTQVDGDQHGMLIGLIKWAQELGLEVLCGGKARDSEYIYDIAIGKVTERDREVTFNLIEAELLQPVSVHKHKMEEVLDGRKALLSAFSQVGGFDLVEMAIVTNATGLLTDAAPLHCPTLSITEIPEVLCPIDMGGILQNRGVIDAVTCLRHPNEAGLSGGVFMVVAADNDYSRFILTSKGATPNKAQTTAVVHHPYHLCGVQTPITILTAALLNVPTGATNFHPHVDVVMEAKVDLQAGYTIGNDHSPDLRFLVKEAQAVKDDAPLPIHMGNGNTLAVDVPAGTLITANMVEQPTASTLWTLRQQQDAHFL